MCVRDLCIHAGVCMYNAHTLTHARHASANTCPQRKAHRCDIRRRLQGDSTDGGPSVRAPPRSRPEEGGPRRVAALAWAAGSRPSSRVRGRRGHPPASGVIVKGRISRAKQVRYRVPGGDSEPEGTSPPPPKQGCGAVGGSVQPEPEPRRAEPQPRSKAASARSTRAGKARPASASHTRLLRGGEAGPPGEPP